ncbi:MAG TPA: gamma-glutamyltransferase [Thermoanaerobaculia bacterium]|nr:gamma-glutamyltransferase [Thermoanaerobaculia bacterium]
MKRLLALTLLFASAVHAASPDPVRARNGMVASVDAIASQVGVDVMKKGGNAVDAAVAVGFTLAVTWPSAGNLGGGGFMLVRTADGKTEAIDYRERAPLAATRDMYLDEKGKVVKGLSTDSYKAAGVPGTVAGMALAHKRHGKLPWADLVEPARKLAADGFIVSHHLAKSLRAESTQKKMARWAESRRIFQRDGRYYSAGERLVQPELAATLARIKKDPRDFYEGETARVLAADVKKNDGLITLEDLKRYEPTVRQPLRGTYRGYEIVAMPPPSSGGIALIEMLHMLEPLDLKALGWGSAHYIHNLVEVQRRAFADRAEYLGDTDFVKAPVDRLVSREHALARRRDIDPYRAAPSMTVKAAPANEPTETTHFSIIDPAGNVVSNTYTINDSYGAGMTVPGLGFLLNDEMDDFTAQPGVPNTWGLVQGEANAIEPRKRPLSSMTPTIVLKDGKVAFAIGSPGGPTIINTVLHVIVNVIDFGMDIRQAIDMPRFHHQWLPDHIFWEEFGMSPDTRAALTRMGHTFRDRPGYSDLTTIGDGHAIAVDPNTGMRMGASDPRRGGTAIGF